jgi:hypothetical protein
VRKVTRHVNEDARDYARSLKGTPEFEKSRDACDGVEVGWGITPDERRILMMTATRNGVAIGYPLKF